MSNNKKKKNKKTNERAEKLLSYGTIIGLVIGTIIGIILFLLTDNMFWMACTPIVTLFVGLGIGSYLGNKKPVKGIHKK
mgnify:CR=1 FL=1